MEDLSDPFAGSDGEGGSYTNTMAAGLFWNAISTMAAVFIFFVAYSEEQVTPKTGELTEGRALFAARGSFGIFLLLILSVFGLSCTTIGISRDWRQCLIYCLTAGAYAILLMLNALLSRGKIAPDFRVSKWQAVKLTQTLVFWTGYVLVLPVVITAANMLSQKRDYTYVVQTIIMSTGIGFGAMAAEMAYSAATEKTVSDKESAKNDEKKTAVVEFLKSAAPKKDDIIFDIFVCVLVQLGAIFCSDFANFPQTPFSNTNKAATYFCVPLLSMIAVLQLVRLLVRTTNMEDILIEKGFTSRNWIPQLAALDFLARLMFTLSLCYDLDSVYNPDNIPLI